MSNNVNNSISFNKKVENEVTENAVSRKSSDKQNNKESEISRRKKSRKSSKTSVKEKLIRESSRKLSKGETMNACCEETHAALLAEISYLHAMVQNLKATTEENSKEIHFLRDKIKGLTLENDSLKEELENLQEEPANGNSDQLNVLDHHISDESYQKRVENSQRHNLLDHIDFKQSFVNSSNYATPTSQNVHVSKMVQREVRQRKETLHRYAANNAMGLWPTEDMKKRRRQKRHQPSNLLRGESDKFILPAINKVQPMIHQTGFDTEFTMTENDRDILKLPKLK